MATRLVLGLVLAVAATALGSAQQPIAPQTNGRTPPSPQTTASTKAKLPVRWWKDEALGTHLALAPAQVQRIDTIFEEFLPGQRQRWGAFRLLEKELDDLLREPHPPEAKVIDQIGRVEALRSELNRNRLVMLFRIQQVLTPAQRSKLDELGWPNTNPRR